MLMARQSPGQLVPMRAAVRCAAPALMGPPCRSNTVVFPAICTAAGVIAGMFGLGGAVVKTPLMLELGVHPQVSCHTLDSSSSNALGACGSCKRVCTAACVARA